MEWLPELIFVVASSIGGVWAAGRWLDPVGDPGFSWSLAYRLAHGDLLYRDVFLAYSPLSPYLLAVVGRLFGFSAVWVTLSNWIPAVVAGVLLLRYGRPFLTTLERIATAGLILAFSLWVPGAGRLVLPYCPEVVHALTLSLGALLVWRNASLSEGIRGLAAGLLGGLAFCCKQEIGLAVLIALVASSLVEIKSSLLRGGRMVVGFALVVAIGGAFVVWSAPLATLRDRNHLWPFDLVPPVQWKYLFRIAAGVTPVDWIRELRHAMWGLLIQVGCLAGLGLLVARERKLLRWRPLTILAAVLLCWGIVEGFGLPTQAPVALSASVAFVIALLAILQPGRSRTEIEQLVAIGVFAGLAGIRAVFSSSITGHFDGPAHLTTSLTWVLLLCVVAPPILAPVPKASLQARRLTAILLLLASWYFAFEDASSLRFLSKEAVDTPRGRIYLDRSNAALYRFLSRQIRPGQTLLVLPEINGLDALFGIRSASPLLFHVPGWLDASLEKDMIRGFEVNPPDAVVLFSRSLREYGVMRFGEGYAELLSTWISTNYEPIAALEGGSLLRKRSGSTGSRHQAAIAETSE